MGSLPPNWQAFAVSQPPVRAHIGVAPDVHRCIASEIALYLITLVDHLANLNHVIVRQLIAIGIQGNCRRPENFPGSASPDPIDICERYLHSLILG